MIPSSSPTFSDTFPQLALGRGMPPDDESRPIEPRGQRRLLGGHGI